MPVPIPDAIAESGDLARAKAEQVRLPGRYFVGALLAGAYVGVAVVLLASVTGPLLAAASPATKLVQGAVFGIALTLVVFAGANLFTGEVMWMLQGLVARTVSIVDLAVVWLVSLIGNLAGSIAFAALVHGGGTLASGGSATKAGPGDALIGSLVTAKNAASGTQLFWRAVLCNMLVCLALWMAARTRSDAAKCIVLFWGLMAFIGSGFEHSVANMTIFGLGIFNHQATWSDLFRNLAVTVPGNIVGGGLVVALAYAYMGRQRGSVSVTGVRSALAASAPATAPLASAGVGYAMAEDGAR